MFDRFDRFPTTAGPAGPRATPAVNLQLPTALVRHVLQMVYGVRRRVPTAIESGLSDLSLRLTPTQRGRLLAALDGAARAAASGAVQDESAESVGFARQTAAALGIAPRRETLNLLAELAGAIFSSYGTGAIVSGPGVAVEAADGEGGRFLGFLAFGWDAEGLMYAQGYENEEDALSDNENLVADNGLVNYYVIKVTAPRPRLAAEVDLPDLPAAQVRLRD